MTTSRPGPWTRFSLQAVFGTGFTYLTSGVFLSGLALLMGAGDIAAGYLSVLANLCGVLLLFCSAALERFESRKRLTLGLTALSRLVTLLLVLVPVLIPPSLRLMVFFLLAVAAFTLQAQTTVVLNQWMLEFLDQGRRGRSIALRQTLTLVVTVVLSVVAGGWMDKMKGQYWGFAVLFAFAGLMAGGELLLLSRIPDGPAYRSPWRGCRLREMAGLPLRDRAFAGFVLHIALFYLLLTFSDSFTTVYMLKYLALPYRTVTTMSLLLSLPQVVLLGLWGRLGDKRGHRFVLTASLWLFAGETLFFSLAGPGSWAVFLPLGFLTASAANAGFSVAVFNRRYELMPQESRIAYDNFYTAAIGLGVLLGPMLGGAVKGILEPVLTAAPPGAGVRGLYLLSTAGILLLQAVSTCRKGTSSR